MTGPRLLAFAALLAFNGRPALAEPLVFEFSTIVSGAGDQSAPIAPGAGPAINEAGVVAFVVSQPGGGHALFLHYPIGFLARVIGTGDALAGSTVARLAPAPGGVDPYAQVVFYAELGDGRSGLFRASPPASPNTVTPTWGYRNQPISFHLRGDGFAPGMQVRFGTTVAGFLTVISPTELTGIIPEGAPAGRVDLVVQRANGVARTLPNAFELRDPPEAGCNGLWRNHRPPALTASGVLSGWLLPGAAVGLYRLWHGARRRRGRRAS